MDIRFVITAEFDLTLGATIREHYPRSDHLLFKPQSQLASLLLPEQVHKSNTDWTYVVLHESNVTGELSLFAVEDETRPLYLINVIQTESGSRYERGQKVTSLAVLSSELWFPILKPVILLASSAYARTESDDERTGVLEELYTSLKNSYNRSEFPQFTWLKKRLLQLSSDPSLFMTRAVSEHARGKSSSAFKDPQQVGFPPNIPGNEHCLRPESTISANNLNSRASSSKLNDLSRDALAVPESSIPHSVRLSSLRGLIMRSNDREKEAVTANLELLAAPLSDVHIFNADITFRNVRLPFKIPTDVTEHLVGLPSLLSLASILSECSEIVGVCDDITVYGSHTPALIALACAIFAQRRVIFVGDESGTASNLCDLVFAAAQLGSAGGYLCQTNKIFPYADLNVAEELSNCKGYIAATTNAAFILHPDWFDLAIDIKNRKLVVSPSIRMEKNKSRALPLLPADRTIIAALNSNKRIAQSSSQTHQQLERAASENCAAWAQSFVRKMAAPNMKSVAHAVAKEMPKCKVIGEMGYPWSIYETDFAEHDIDSEPILSPSTLGQIASNKITGPAAASSTFASEYGKTVYKDANPVNNSASTEFKHNHGEQASALFSAVYGSTTTAWMNSGMPQQFDGFLSQVYWRETGNVLVDFYYASRVLSREKPSRQESAVLLEHMANGLQTENDTIRFILETASIYSLSLGLFHPDSGNAVCQALARVREHPVSEVLFAEIPQFHINALERMWEQISRYEFEFCRKGLHERRVSVPPASHPTAPVLSLLQHSETDLLTLTSEPSFRLT